MRVSDSVLESLARTLRLEQDERFHLYMANRNVPLKPSAEAPTTMQTDLNKGKLIKLL